jgi:SAM-dependent methyltransferase
MSAYKPGDFWEKSHSSISSADVELGSGIQYVGGGQSNPEAKTLYCLRRINARRVLRKCALPTNPKIFELGSGGGFWVEFFRQFSPSLFLGSDLSATAVDRLQSLYPNYSFISMADASSGWEQIKQRGPYDLCLAIDVLYHIVDDASWRNALSKLCENCKPEGSLLLADYFYEQPRDSPSASHVKWRPIQAYLDVLDEYGFQVAHIQPIFYFLNRIVNGPWKDHTGLTAVFLKHMISSKLGLGVLSGLDSVITKFARPMSPKSKTRFLLAKRK